MLSECASSNSAAAWHRLLTFAFRVLNSSRADSSKKVSLNSILRGNLARWQNGEPDPAPQSTRKTLRNPNPRPNPDEASRLARLVEQKVFEGDVTGAVRLSSSSEGFCQPSAESYAALAAKHPISAEALNPPALPVTPHLVVNPEEVAITINRFKAASAAGPDGLRPAHLKDLVSPQNGEAGIRLLEALTRVINSILAGSVPVEIRPLLFGANLIALRKKDGGIRPIAVGCTLRRIAAKLGCSSIIELLRPYLQPLQMGFGTPGGAEAIHRAVRLFVAAAQPSLLAKLDFENAFNTLLRQWLLDVSSQRIPSLFPLVLQAYGAPSHLLFGDFLISSEVGLQQGDPLAPALFCLAIQPMIESLSSTLNAHYLDDGTLGDKADVVADDIAQIKQRSAEIGLKLNPAKCELFLIGEQDPAVMKSISLLLPGAKITSAEDLELLGAPITDEALPHALAKKITTIRLLVKRLESLQSHVALFLLKSCLSIPKMVYLLRCAPAWKEPLLLESFDQVMRESLESILNCSIDDPTWAQASLPVAKAGIGIRSARDLSVPAFLASIASTSDLVTAILANSIPPVDPDLDEALAIWDTASDSAPTPDSKYQRDWDRPIVDKLASSLLAHAASPSTSARILASTRKESGAWLQALPCPNLGTFLDESTVRIAAGLRLGIPLCHPHPCHNCGATVDRSGTHGLCCRNSKGRWSRHGALNDTLLRAMSSAGVPATLEPQGLIRDDGKRPDGLTLVPWSKGKCLTWDATCCDTLAASHLPSTSKTSGAAAHSAQLSKHRKYSQLPDAYILCPFAVETLGPFGQDAIALVDELGRRIHRSTGEPRSRSFLVQRLSIAIQRGNSAAVLGTIPPSSKFDEIYTI